MAKVYRCGRPILLRELLDGRLAAHGVTAHIPEAEPGTVYEKLEDRVSAYGCYLTDGRNCLRVAIAYNADLAATEYISHMVLAMGNDVEGILQAIRQELGTGVYGDNEAGFRRSEEIAGIGKKKLKAFVMEMTVRMFREKPEIAVLENYDDPCAGEVYIEPPVKWDGDWLRWQSEVRICFLPATTKQDKSARVCGGRSRGPANRKHEITYH